MIEQTVGPVECYKVVRYDALKDALVSVFVENNVAQIYVPGVVTTARIGGLFVFDSKARAIAWPLRGWGQVWQCLCVDELIVPGKQFRGGGYSPWEERILRGYWDAWISGNGPTCFANSIDRFPPGTRAFRQVKLVERVDPWKEDE